MFLSEAGTFMPLATEKARPLALPAVGYGSWPMTTMRTFEGGDLTAWAKQGVLLLNTVLTVREGEANSHKGRGWEQFTSAVLEQVNQQPGPVVFLCFGKPATALAQKRVDTKKHAIIVAPHPSPLNGNKFVDAAAQERIFSKTNELLKAGGREPIDWAIGG